MSDAISSNEPEAFNRTVADLKHGIESATAAQTAASEKAMAKAKDFAAFSQGTFQAFTESSQVLASGSQDLIRQAAETGRIAMTESLSNFRAIASAKTLKECLELQANFFRTAATWTVSEASRLANANIELAEKAAAPLMARALVATEAVNLKA